MSGRDILWDLDGTEYQKPELADMGSGGDLENAGISKLATWSTAPSPSLPLPTNYELTTEIIKNQTEMLAMLLKGMRQ